MAQWSERGTKINKTDGVWDLNNGRKFKPADGIRASDINKVVEATLYTQITSDEALQTAQQAQEDIKAIEINVAEERGTVVTENGQPKAQVEWNDKLDKTPKEPKVVSDAFLSRITATNDIEILDSPLGIKTAKIQKIKGLSIKQVFQNGDFSDGTNGWSANLATLSVSNKVLTVTVNSLGENVGFDGSGQPKSIANRPYYISAYINPKYANNVRIGYGDNYASFSGSGLLANQWNFVSAIVIPEQSGETFLFYHYAASGYTVGDTFRVADVRCIDLVDSSLTGWTKEQLDAVIPHLSYSEGIRHTNVKKLVSTGDNLIKLEPKTETYYGVTTTVNADCTITLNGTSVSAVDVPIIGSLSGDIILKYPVNDLQLIVEHISGTISGGTLYVMVDGRLFNDGTALYSQQIACSIPAGSTGGVYKSYVNNERPGFLHDIRLYIGQGRTFNNLKLRVMLVHKNNPLISYKLYNENILQLPQYELLKLPNGVADEIDLTNRAYIKRVGKIVIDGTQEVAQYQGAVGGTYAFFVTIPDYKNKPSNDYVPNILANRLLTLGGETMWDKTYPCVGPYTNGRIVVRDYFPSYSVAEAKTYLAQNPITLYFELDEYTIEPLEQEWDNTYPAWNYGLEQLYDTDGNHEIAELDIQYPLDVIKQVDTNTWLLAEQEKQIKRLSIYEETLIDTYMSTQPIPYSQLAVYDLIRCEMYADVSGYFLSGAVISDSKTFSPNLLYRHTRPVWVLATWEEYDAGSPKIDAGQFLTTSDFLAYLSTNYPASEQQPTATARGREPQTDPPTPPYDVYYAKIGEISSFGKVVLENASLERTSEALCTFTAPTAVPGKTWKLKIYGIRNTYA